MSKNNSFIFGSVLLSAFVLYKLSKKENTERTEFNDDSVKLAGDIVDNNIGGFTRLNDR